MKITSKKLKQFGKPIHQRRIVDFNNDLLKNPLNIVEDTEHLELLSNKDTQKDEINGLNNEKKNSNQKEEQDSNGSLQIEESLLKDLHEVKVKKKLKRKTF